MTDRVGSQPEPRTVQASGSGDCADWHIVMRSDFSARMLEELRSGDAGRIMLSADKLVVSHNFPGIDGEVAASILDAVPLDCAVEVVSAALVMIGKLPNR